MKIRIDDLPPEGLSVNDTIPLEPLNKRMSEGRYKDIVFITAPKVELSVRKTQEGGAETFGKISSRYKQACGRCADMLEKDIEVEANFTLLNRPPPDSRKVSKEDDEDDEIFVEETFDDVGLIYFDDSTVDLEDMIQETLILALSPFWSPPCDKAGNCELCGFNIDKGIAGNGGTDTGKVLFSDLLKKAKKMPH